jgi:hypothetical protein
LECCPAFDYARAAHQCTIDSRCARFDGPNLKLVLMSPVPLQLYGNGVIAEFTLSQGENVTFAVRHIGPGDDPGRCGRSDPIRVRRTDIDRKGAATDV